MERINRNDPCPCGSGKKYKRCCGANEAVSIIQLLESEVDELQRQMLHFAITYFGVEIEDDFESFVTSSEIEFDDEQERQFFEMIHAIWFSLFEELDDGATIIEKFIGAEAGKIKRPRLREILQSWTKARTIAGKVISVEGNKLTVEDGFSGEQLEAIVTGVSVELEAGSFLIGMIVPFEQNYMFFPTPFDLPTLTPDYALSYMKDSSMDADYDSPQEYLTDFFMEVMSELPMVGGVLEIDDLEWPAPIYKEVAGILKTRLDALDVPPPIVDTGVVLWYTFCQHKQKRIQNPKLYAAALHYLLATIAPMEEVVTQKKLAQDYGVSAGSISPIVSELENTLRSEIEELLGVVYSDETGALGEEAEIIEFPTNRESKGSDKNRKK